MVPMVGRASLAVPLAPAGLLALVAVLALGGCSGPHAGPVSAPPVRTPSASATRSVPSAPSSTPVAFTAQQAAALSAALAAGTPAGLAQAVAVPPGQAVDPYAAAGLREAGPITFDVSTFKRLDADDATVSATVAHPPAGSGPRWVFTLSWVGGAWRIADARPLL